MLKFLKRTILVFASYSLFGQSASKVTFADCENKKSNAEICACMVEKVSLFQRQITKEIDLVRIEIKKKITNQDGELKIILSQQYELLEKLKPMLIQVALVKGEFDSAESLGGSGYGCIKAEEQYEELNKIWTFLIDYKEVLKGYE